MQTILSERRRKFYSLVRQAHEQPTEWLRAVVIAPGPQQSRLATLACLRIIIARNASGRPYQEKRAAVKAELRALAQQQ